MDKCGSLSGPPGSSNSPKRTCSCLSMLKTPQCLPHHLQDEVQSHYYSIMVNPCGVVTANPSYLYLILLSYTLCSSHIELNVLYGMDNFPSCLQMFAYAVSSLWNFSCVLLSLLNSSDILLCILQDLAHMLLPGSPLDPTCPSHPLYSLSLLAEFGPLSPISSVTLHCC